MRFVFALCVSMALHAGIAALLIFYFDRDNGIDELAKLDLSSVELAIVDNETERADAVQDAPPRVRASDFSSPKIKLESPRFKTDDCEVAVKVPEAEPIAIPFADDPALPDTDMTAPSEIHVEKAVGSASEATDGNGAAESAASSSAAQAPELSPVKVRVEPKLKDKSFRVPEYPKASRRRGEKGVVRLRIGIDIRGLVESVEIVGSSGFRLLDEAAVKAVRAARFIPASVGGEAVFSTTELNFEFRLHDKR